jgi:hypothetical protein
MWGRLEYSAARFRPPKRSSKETTNRLERANSRSSFPEPSLPATASQRVPVKLLGTEVLSKDSLFLKETCHYLLSQEVDYVAAAAPEEFDEGVLILPLLQEELSAGLQILVGNPLGETPNWGMKALLQRHYIGPHQSRNE